MEKKSDIFKGWKFSNPYGQGSLGSSAFRLGPGRCIPAPGALAPVPLPPNDGLSRRYQPWSRAKPGSTHVGPGPSSANS